MAHILAKIQNVQYKVIKELLKNNASKHREQGLILEHVWQNSDKEDEVLFLFKAENIHQAKKFIEKTHNDARREHPDTNLPEMIFLEEK